MDAGLTAKETKRRLGLIGVKPEELDCVLVTHEHTDHVKGIGAFCRAVGLPVYLTPKTRAAAESWLGGKLRIMEFEPGAPFMVRDMQVEPFSIPHDAADPVGFAFHCGGLKVGFATDVGYPNKLLAERLKGADILVIESNHDPSMLQDGPYPWYLKQRVAGRQGHLSNEESSRLLAHLAGPKLRHVILAHISQVNNLPELALECALRAIEKVSADHVKAHLAGQNDVSVMVEVC